LASRLQGRITKLAIRRYRARSPESFILGSILRNRPRSQANVIEIEDGESIGRSGRILILGVDRNHVATFRLIEG
jgi:hypothetical protein